MQTEQLCLTMQALQKVLQQISMLGSRQAAKSISAGKCHLCRLCRRWVHQFCMER